MATPAAHPAIVEVKSRTWDDKPVRHKKRPQPKPVDPESPKLFPLALFAGSRGQGKSFAASKLVEHYLRTGIQHETEPGVMQDQRVIIFSPTYQANPVLHVLKPAAEDVIEEFSIAALKDREESIYAEEERSLEYLERKKIYDKWRRSGYDEGRMSYSELATLTAMAFEPPTKPRYPNGPAITHVLFDDLLGLKNFNNNPSLVNLCIRNRHRRICVYIMGQSVRQVPKIIRLNCSLLFLYRFANAHMVMDDMAELCGAVLLEDEFMALYEHCVKEPHTPFFLDLSDMDKPIYRKGFETYVSLRAKRAEDGPVPAPPDSAKEIRELPAVKK